MKNYVWICVWRFNFPSIKEFGVLFQVFVLLLLPKFNFFETVFWIFHIFSLYGRFSRTIGHLSQSQPKSEVNLWRFHWFFQIFSTRRLRQNFEEIFLSCKWLAFSKKQICSRDKLEFQFSLVCFRLFFYSFISS